MEETGERCNLSNVQITGNWWPECNCFLRKATNLQAQLQSARAEGDARVAEAAEAAERLQGEAADARLGEAAAADAARDAEREALELREILAEAHQALLLNNLRGTRITQPLSLSVTTLHTRSLHPYFADFT